MPRVKSWLPSPQGSDPAAVTAQTHCPPLVAVAGTSLQCCVVSSPFIAPHINTTLTRARRIFLARRTETRTSRRGAMSATSPQPCGMPGSATDANPGTTTSVPHIG